MAYQPQYQAPPRWQVWLAARWRAWCAWWMYRPAAQVQTAMQAAAQDALGRRLSRRELRFLTSSHRSENSADLRWYAAEDESSEGQQAATEPVRRHRAPEEQQPVDPWQEPAELTEQQRDEHAGATADWSPTGELRQIMAGELSPVETLPSVVISTEIRVPQTAALAADVHAALDGWDDLFKVGFKRIDDIIAAAAERQYPKAYIAERAREATQLIPIVTSELVAA